jgi:hypothetical protein
MRFPSNTLDFAVLAQIHDFHAARDWRRIAGKLSLPLQASKGAGYVLTPPEVLLLASSRSPALFLELYAQLHAPAPVAVPDPIELYGAIQYRGRTVNARDIQLHVDPEPDDWLYMIEQAGADTALDKDGFITSQALALLLRLHQGPKVQSLRPLMDLTR